MLNDKKRSCDYCNNPTIPLFRLDKVVSALRNRGGGLEDVLGLEDALKDSFGSPWP